MDVQGQAIAAPAVTIPARDADSLNESRRKGLRFFHVDYPVSQSKLVILFVTSDSLLYETLIIDMKLK